MSVMDDQRSESVMTNNKRVEYKFKGSEDV